MTTATDRRPGGAPDLPARAAAFWDPHTPVHFDAGLDTWHVFSRADVLRVLDEKETFSAGYGLTDAERRHAHPSLAGMWAAEGARHDDLRAAVADPFRRTVLDRLTEEVRALVTTLLDGVLAAGTGTLDAVRALADELPSQVICRLLGLDVAHAAKMRAWVAELSRHARTTSELPPQPELVRFFRELIAARRAAPGTGLVDELIAAQRAGYRVAGRPMTEADLVGFFAMLLSAGVDTTATSIGNAFLFLTEYGCWDLLGREPGLVPHAVEETLRWYPAFPAVRRYVLADTAFGGQHVRAGQWVTGWLTSANRDPDRFPDPDRFDIRRRPNPHLSLGHGRHHCLGAPLARLELKVLVEEATARLPGLRRDPAHRLVRRQWIVDPLESLPMTFDRAAGHRPPAAAGAADRR
ncbi:cytochrome P450 [Streptomyces sp. RS10V-4]|uniref:cytochrome P450 n=1 Tax=Streptomyces rhizoryzae TaxID=2932493 RepID=UPI00200309E1|nr:cytochrome P450 [Streptomyces rhizoryzae]MCK7625845.1 cytochrome P450 [Streptomyces rhizoryzae]